MPLNPSQKKFCELYVNGMPATDAYMQAYGNDNTNSCAVSAVRLLKSKKIDAEIKRLQSLNNEIVKAATVEAIKDDVKRDIMQRGERMETLTMIARGKVPLKKPMVVDKEIVLIDVVPDYMDRKNAIAELNKMDGSYAPANANITTTTTNPATTAIVLNFDGNKIEIVE